jgi:hypothetical protein
VYAVPSNCTPTMACGGKLGKKSPIDMVVISDDQVI